MPVQVYEDSLELTFDVLEECGYTKASWPYPALKQTGHQEKRSFRAIILENEYLKLTFLPELGGRLWEFWDKRSAQDALRNSDGPVQSEYGVRRIQVNKGLLLSQGESHRHRALGSVDWMVFQPESDSDAGEVMFVDFTQISGALKFVLSPQSAEVRIDVVVQNRGEKSTIGRPNTFIFDRDCDQTLRSDGVILESIYVSFEPGTFCQHLPELNGVPFRLQRERDMKHIAPRQVDSFSLNLQPYFGIGNPNSVGPAGVGELSTGDQPQISFCASTPLLQHKLILQTESGQTFEAEVNIHPEAVYRAPLNGIPEAVVAAQLKSPEGEPVATFGTLSSELSPMIHGFAGTGVPWILPREYDDATLLALTADVGLRVPAYLELAARATERGDYQRADTCYEHALLFNGDDPLAWWAKSVNRRIGNLDDENAERTELLNAHYLSPLEPCLRAEAFLAQPRNHGKDPSPLLASFNDVPENFVEVACQLIQARFYEDAAYFIDEALRHQNLGMLHYLHAYLLSRKGGMEMEVASRVQMATKAKFPPMPYRDLEREVLMKLVEIHKLPQPIMDWLSDQLPE